MLWWPLVFFNTFLMLRIRVEKCEKGESGDVGDLEDAADG